MLQQTQVDRVIPYYKAFLKKFPTVKALAKAPLSEVLRLWQGLGYNRRAKMLHEAAKASMSNHGGRIPQNYEELITLPGVGDYTAKAVRVFAFNKPEVMIETNIRAAFLHHFFSRKQQVEDNTLLPIIEKTLDNKKPREWYAALMDYGAYLKRTLPNPSRKSAHHTKQSPFKGSDREIRGALLKKAATEPLTDAVIQRLPFTKKRIKAQLSALVYEGLLAEKKGVFSLPQ